MAIFGKFGTPYEVTIYGNLSTEVLENARAGELDVKLFSFLTGVQTDLNNVIEVGTNSLDYISCMPSFGIF